MYYTITADNVFEDYNTTYFHKTPPVYSNSRIKVRVQNKNINLTNSLEDLHIFGNECNKSMEHLMMTLNNYYLLDIKKRKELLEKNKFNTTLFQDILKIIKQNKINSYQTEIIKIMLGYFPTVFFNKILDIISNEDEDVFFRLLLVETIPFFIQIDESERLLQLNEIKNQINNKHILSFLQETIESFD